MPIFDCPICHYKSFTEKEAKEHYANKHKEEEIQPTKTEVKKPEQKKPAPVQPAEPAVKKAPVGAKLVFEVVPQYT